MKSIALIHTVKSVAAGFDDSLRNYLGYEVKIHNLWDDFLANNPNEVGEFTIQNRNRLLCDMKAQELTGADIIVTTCSTLTPAVELIRPFIRVPVIAIDDAMARRSVLYGKRIMVMATAESTVGPTVSKIKAEADKAGREADISTCVCMDAFHAMRGRSGRYPAFKAHCGPGLRTEGLMRETLEEHTWKNTGGNNEKHCVDPYSKERGSRL